ncbi:IclR family transcriptional regulator [Streptomyces sp. WP-1]|uniref:IclR family transcriptional regulator n=1 Tax=Streptomyces sp. WP-1 TaxID=3041497 RepID=UPI002647F0B3|nr:IclR family transcriptional regulator [Streptomyces sp. WP-1]WKE67807.1 IclR family transcriptional regulator [Streptomyces sp. WP-1]
MTGTGDTGRGPVKSAERTVQLMEVLSASPERLTLGRLQELTGYPRSSLYALLRTLVALKWIEVEEGGEAAGFGIGPRALLCGTAYLDRDPALPYAVRQIEQLRADVGYTTHYARLDGSNVIYLATREATDSRRLTSRVGRQLPAHATALGKALLSELTAREVDALLSEQPLEALTPHTVTRRPALREELEQTRTRGWALESEQNTPGLCCVAATVSYRIPATDAISCSIPLDHATDQEIERVAEAVTRHATALAGTLRRNGIR